MSKQKNKKNKGKKRRKKKNPIVTFFTSAVIVILVCYVGIASYLYINQRNFLYFPSSDVLQNSEQKLEISSEDLTLRGWVVNEGNQNAILYFGGNAEQPETNIADFKELFPNHTLYFINYRGYGESDGLPTEEGIYSDALTIYDVVSQNHNQITVIGRSLGTGVATYLVTNRNVDKLILIEPYDSLVNIAQGIYPIFPMNLLMKDKFDSASRAHEITIPTLIIKAENDEVIPSASTDRLVACFRMIEPEIVTVDNASHNDIQNYTQFYQYLMAFEANSL